MFSFEWMRRFVCRLRSLAGRLFLFLLPLLLPASLLFTVRNFSPCLGFCPNETLTLLLDHPSGLMGQQSLLCLGLVLLLSCQC